jgi:hypothetical protein
MIIKYTVELALDEDSEDDTKTMAIRVQQTHPAGESLRSLAPEERQLGNMLGQAIADFAVAVATERYTPALFMVIMGFLSEGEIIMPDDPDRELIDEQRYQEFKKGITDSDLPDEFADFLDDLLNK